ncbi:MAG: hypothetical protein HY561_02905 [Gemmatimonadetes bacterium]|nr:hypothetical protein [Gemmatimonadota bacterium]
MMRDQPREMRVDPDQLENVVPPLSDDEWRALEARPDQSAAERPRYAALGGPAHRELTVEPGTVAVGRDRHALAALALHAQPFGFSWTDVDALVEAIGCAAEVGHANVGVRLYNLADRIAALLPPREGYGV